MLEAHANILAVLATVAGIVISISLFPQAYKIYKRKSSADVSLLSLLILFFALIPWLLYGISISNLPIIITNGVSMVGAALTISTYLHYKDIKKS